MRLCLFGIPRVEDGDVVIDRFPTRRCILILARLAMAHQRRMSRIQLADTLWPDEIYEVSRHRLRQELTRLRRTLGDANHLLETSAEAIRLDLAHCELDVDDFERFSRAASQTVDPGQQLELLRKAVQLAPDSFMSGSNEDWIEVERMRLNAGRYTAMVNLGEVFLSQGNPSEALALAKTAIGIVPDREGAHLLAVKSFRILGHAEDAGKQFESLRRTVSKAGGHLSGKAELLGIEIAATREPSPETHRCLRFAIPAPVEPIIGRSDVLEAIVNLFNPNQNSPRLVTVLGMGGIGKTHVILYACRDLAILYGSRVAYIDLSNLNSASLIPSTIMSLLGLGYVPTSDPIDQLKHVLGDDTHVLALDNLEQFETAAAPVLRRLLTEIPTLRILAGSRIPLNIAGETRLYLAPLSLPAESAGENEAMASEALRLFISILGSDQTSPIKDWPTVSNIVRRLDGVPLGLQIAASRMRTQGPTALLEDLNNGFDFLVNQREDAPERHRSLNHALAVSFARLDPALKNAISELSIFRGGWSLEAAAQVCEIADPSPTMQRLADVSLVTIVNDGTNIRFRMLEPIREYAKSLLSERRSHDLRRRLVAWMVERSRKVAFDIVTLDVKQAIDKLEVEHNNLREALRYSLDEFPDSAFELGANLASYWLFRTSGFEAIQFYSELWLRYPFYPESITVLEASYGHSLIAHMTTNADNQNIFERTLRLGRTVGDRSLEIKTLVFKAFRAQNTMQYAECQAIFDEIDGLVAQCGWFDSQAFVSRIRGIFTQYQGDLDSAIRHYRDAGDWFASQGELFYRASSRKSIASAAMEFGDTDLAEANLAGLLQEATQIRYFLLIPDIHRNLGLLALQKKQYEKALEEFHLSIDGFRDLGVGFNEGNQWNAIGRTYFAMDRMADARSAFAKAGQLWLADGLPVAVAVAVIGLAAVSHREGGSARAARFLAAASHVIREAGASIVRFETEFADQLALDLEAFTPSEPALTLEEALRLGALSI